MTIEIVTGDLLEQRVDAIVNPWNRNTIPWWLLLPRGVSGAIKRRAGTGPFRQLRQHGRMKLGEAVVTGPGRMPFKAIIHVAGINDLWRASETSIRQSVRNAVSAGFARRFESIALPIVGAGSGGFPGAEAEQIILDELSQMQGELHVVLVRFRSQASNR